MPLVHQALDERVLLLAPTARDARLSTALLAEASIDCALCMSMGELCAEIGRGAGAVLLHEEALLSGGREQLVGTLAQQMIWSDLPIIVLVAGLASDATATKLRQHLGNLLVLERPVRVSTLLSAVQTALRTRHRQYQVRLLSEVGQVLTSSLDAQAMLNQIAELLVPSIADICSVYLVEGVALQRAAQASSNPKYQTLAKSLNNYPLTPGNAAPLWRVLHSGQPDLRPQIRAADVPVSSSNDEQQIIAQFGVTSHLLLPLLVQGRASGILALGMIESDRQFSEAHLPFMHELTTRVAPALENVRLFAAEQRARAEAERAVQAREELMALITHDLKNPLTTLLGQAQLLRRRLMAHNSTPERMERSLTAIEHAALRMHAQINGLLDSIRLRAGQPLDLQQTTTDLVSLVRSVVGSIAQTTDHHQFKVVATVTPLLLELDVPRIERVLDNLLGNAIKYSPAGGTITVTMGVEWQNDTRYALTEVQDEGVGIPADDLPHLFEPYHRAANVLTTIQGSGIGLASVYQIVIAHGGWVDVQSTVGQGSAFRVALPIADLAPDKG